MPGNILRGRTMDRFVNIISVLLSIINDSCLRYSEFSCEEGPQKNENVGGFQKANMLSEGFYSVNPHLLTFGHLTLGKM